MKEFDSHAKLRKMLTNPVGVLSPVTAKNTTGYLSA